MNDSTTRFSDRVENYLRYRPSYPQGVIDTLINECGLSPETKVAEIGSGTGILSKLILERGSYLYAVEPNKEMREAGEQFLGDHDRLNSVNGTAESTMLDDRSIDLIVAAQAFHWFDRTRCREEFRRILRPNGHVALIWNERDDRSPFLQEYEDFLRETSNDYTSVNHKNLGQDSIVAFFAPNLHQTRSYPNHQIFDFESFKGRVFSSSYMPNSNAPESRALIRSLKTLFDRHQREGVVRFDYVTTIHFGRLE